MSPTSNSHQPSTANHQHPPPSSSSTLPPTAIASSASVFSRMPLEDVLEDLASRFILNLPIVELSQIERVCFQVEQAHWFYEDFVRPNSLLNLPSYHLKTFTALFFEKCEFLTIDGAPLAGWDPKTAYEKFMRYKERVPVCGAIMFNEDASQVLLVRGFKHNSSWSFPRGKINENELPKDCAIREVREETGFNIAPYMSLPSSSSEDSKLSAIRKTRPTNPTPNGQSHHHQSHKPHSNCTLHSEGDDHFIEITIREQRLRMYLVTGIPNDTKFVTQTRQEIGRIAWFPVSDLPTFSTSNGALCSKQLYKMINVSCPSAVESDGNQRVNAKFYMVVPFVNDMRTWLTNNHLLTPVGQPLSTPREHHQRYVQTPPQNNHQGYHGNLSNRHTELEDEAAAVHERASRLQAFDFLQDGNTSTDHIDQDNRLTCSNTRKKNRRKQQQQQRKPQKETHHHQTSMDHLTSYHVVDPQTSTANEDISVKNDTPWNDLEEGTRALQNFFFGARNDDDTGGEACDIPTDGGDAFLEIHIPHGATNNGTPSPFIPPQARATPDRSQRHPPRTTMLALDQRHDQLPSHQSANLQPWAPSNPPLENEYPLSEADTDIVKGGDVTTSYASSMSSNYSGPCQTAEVMYSKHGHLAAPRPKAAPQQVERLLAMLQAPTPGPPKSSALPANNFLSQLMSSAQQEQQLKLALNIGCDRQPPLVPASALPSCPAALPVLKPHMGEEERQEKKQVLLRQLQSLARA
ncbi:hypothetical protein PCASD_03423 [Puccinia coronata f. sp. avenae]|uniref:Nudix hydrolase domain-containing protein n=1 Tax=Puccinia coronata f. sp. avenae TaxID=200324 RepID=A0A2N5VF79_9BASI|nr:hypothetical protein PCASD_07455 [Puccinia coronata f. sp. avenae]PLW48655.1 hypothetical protein PCASD_03423 [Puccinia coronata f. sp. avenae]